MNVKIFFKKNEGHIVSNAVYKLSKRRTDTCPLDLAKPKSLVRNAVSVEWFETRMLKLVEKIMWEKGLERMKVGNSFDKCCYKGDK